MQSQACPLRPHVKRESLYAWQLYGREHPRIPLQRQIRDETERMEYCTYGASVRRPLTGLNAVSF
jgi:hypothetical protein